MPKRGRATDTESFIRLAKEIHGDKDDYSLTVFTASRNFVKLVCVIGGHGEYQQTANNHLRNHRCSKCRDHGNKIRQTMSKEEVIRRCEERHAGLVDYSKIGEYVNNRTPMKFVCIKCKTEYMRDMEHMLGDGRGHGCPKCNGGVADTRESFIAKANIKHDNYYNYELVEYMNSITKVKIACPCGRTFDQTPGHHLGGCGCPYCIGRHRTIEDFKRLSAEKFPGKNFDFSKAVLNNMKSKITITCPSGHEFNVNPHVHLRSETLGGCRRCADNLIATRSTYTLNEWLIVAQNRHGDKYDYSKVEYKSSKHKVTIICTIHGEFEQNTTSHTQGAGCPFCINKTAGKLRVYLEKLFKVTLELTPKWCPSPKGYFKYDFYIQDIGIIVELDGVQHFKPIAFWSVSGEILMKRDVYKIRCANKNGIRVIRILQEDVWENDESWLDTNLKPLLVKKNSNDNEYIGDMYDEHKKMMTDEIEIDPAEFYEEED